MNEYEADEEADQDMGNDERVRVPEQAFRRILQGEFDQEED